MSKSAENTSFAAFKVNKVRRLKSNIQYLALFYPEKIVFSKIGGQFADGGLGVITGGVLGGMLGALVGDAVEKRLQKRSDSKRGEKMRSIYEMTEEEIVSMDKENFEIYYSDITQVSINKSKKGLKRTWSGVLSIEGKINEKFDITPDQSLDVCEEILRTHLSDKFLDFEYIY